VGKVLRREVIVKKKIEEFKRTLSHVSHFGHLPFRDVYVECVSSLKHCRVKKRKERERRAKRRSERMSETNRGHFRRKKEEEKRKKKKGRRKRGKILWRDGLVEKKKEELKTYWLTWSPHWRHPTPRYSR